MHVENFSGFQHVDRLFALSFRPACGILEKKKEAVLALGPRPVSRGQYYSRKIPMRRITMRVCGHFLFFEKVPVFLPILAARLRTYVLF